MLKFTVLVVVVAICAPLSVTADPDAELMKIHGECLKEHSLTGEDLKKHMKDAELPENILCYLKCLNTKSGIISEDGTVDHEKLANNPVILKAEEADRKEMLNCASSITKIDTCKAVVPLKDCYMRLKEKLGTPPTH